MKIGAKNGRIDSIRMDASDLQRLSDLQAASAAREPAEGGPGERESQVRSGQLPVVGDVDGQIFVARVNDRWVSLAQIASETPAPEKDGKWRALARITASNDRISRVQLTGLGDGYARLHDRDIYVAKADTGTLSLDAYRKVPVAERDGDVTVRHCVCDVVLKDGLVRQIVMRGMADEFPSASGVFSGGRKENNVVLRRRSAHGYYISGIENKEDITDEWNSDFRAAADAVLEDRRTLLDYDRLYTLWQMVRNVRASEAPMLEVGVLRGGTSAFLARAAGIMKKKGRIFACDTFSGHAETHPALDGRHDVGTFVGRTSFEDVRDYLSAYDNVEVVQGDIKETASRIGGPALSLLHLDVDVFETTRYVLDTFAGRMVAGGVIVVDDYAVKTCKGVKLAVDEFVDRNPGFSFLHLLTGQAVMTRLASGGT